MKLFIDCEFNEFKGELISMGIVDENGRPFYEVLECSKPGDWVAANVMPVLNQAHVSYNVFQRKLCKWLAEYDSVHLIADWPEDIAHFCNVLITGPGNRMNTPALTMTIDRSLNSEMSLVPHNALEDAHAIRTMYVLLKKGFTL